MINPDVSYTESGRQKLISARCRKLRVLERKGKRQVYFAVSLALRLLDAPKMRVHARSETKVIKHGVGVLLEPAHPV